MREELLAATQAQEKSQRSLKDSLDVASAESSKRHSEAIRAVDEVHTRDRQSDP